VRIKATITNSYHELDKEVTGPREKMDKLSAPMCQIDGNTLPKAALSNLLVGMTILPLWHGMKYYKLCYR
jgi:hypothetical protein